MRWGACNETLPAFRGCSKQSRFFFFFFFLLENTSAPHLVGTFRLCSSSPFPWAVCLSFWEKHSTHGNLHFLRQGMTRSPTPGCLVRAAIARFHLNKLIKGPALGIILRGQSLFLPGLGLNVFERNPLCLDGSGRFSCIKSAASYGVHGACSRGELGQDYVGRGATYLRDLERSEGWTGGPSPKLCLTRLMSALFV